MADTGPPYIQRIRAGVRPGVGLGLLVGAAEVVRLALDLRLPLGFVGFAGVGLLALLVNAAVGGLAAGLAGLVVHLEPPDPDSSRRPTTLATLVARQIAGAGLIHVGVYLWEGAGRLAFEDASPASVATLAALPFGWAAVVYFQARFWLRRAEALGGWSVRVPAVAAGMSLVVLAVAATAYALRDPGGTAPERTPSVVLVTVDGLRADAVSPAATPAFEALAADGVRFADAVTPTPETRAANASVLVGLHPLRHQVLSDHHGLSRAYRSVFEVLAEEGWATGAFVSGRTAAASSGLAQGFATVDDALGLGSFAERVHVIGRIGTLVRFATGWSGSHRSARATVDRFEWWLERRDEPFAAWIHLDEPHVAAVNGTDYGAAVRATDDAIGRIRELVAARTESPTGVIVLGTHGELLGAHGGTTNRTLYEEVVRVPLAMTLPGLPIDAPVVDVQVRTMDIAATIVDWLQAPALDESEGIALTGYAAGARRATIWCSLVGRDLGGRWILGLRNNGVKVVRKPEGGEELYDVRRDPGEQHDQAAEQRGVVLQARSLLASDAAALDAWLR